MPSQALVEERVVGADQFEDAAVAAQDAIQEKIGFAAERLAQGLVEILKQQVVRRLGFNVVQEEPLLGKIGDQRLGARIGEHPARLLPQDHRIAELSTGGDVQQLVIGNAAP